MDQPSLKFESSSYLQKLAGLGAVCSAFTAVIMTSTWANGTGTDFLGGMNWSTHIFGWHPVLMIFSLIFCSVSALVSYRLFPFTKRVTKNIHIACHSLAVVCMTVGFTAIYLSHSNPNYNTSGTYKSNFTTIHSFLGIAAILLYSQNYIFGILNFILPKAIELRKQYMPSHIFLGIFALITACMAAVTGVMEKSGNCYYTVDYPDYNSAANYGQLSWGCRLGNGVGIMVLLTLFLAVYALWDHDRGAGVEWRYAPVKEGTEEL